MGQFGVGQAVRRVEDARLLTGQGRYTDDINLPGQVFGVVIGLLLVAVATDWLDEHGQELRLPSQGPLSIRFDALLFAPSAGQEEWEERLGIHAVRATGKLRQPD